MDIDPLNAVTFVDNADTDLSYGENVIWNKMLGYALILTAEGYPSVYYKDYSTDGGCYGLKPLIDNLIWIHENLAFGPKWTRWGGDPQVYVFERQGHPGLLVALNNDQWNSYRRTVQTSFGANVQLHEYTGKHPDVWTDGQGRATFTVPRNINGQSYLCFSRTGYGQTFSLNRRTTIQTFFGAADLDTLPAENDRAVEAGRIWCQQGTPIEAELKPDTTGWSTASKIIVDILDAQGNVLTSTPYTEHALHNRMKAIADHSGWVTLRVTGHTLPVERGTLRAYRNLHRHPGAYAMSFAITTRSYDNTRSGANLQEQILTPAAVGRRGMKRLFSLPLPGDARGCEAQPLIVPGVKLADGSTHDVVYVATMANQVFAFDANTGAQLWVVQLGTPIKSNPTIDDHPINDHWGILSTPVIDAQAGVMYACTWTSPDGSPNRGQHFLQAIRLRDGSAVHPPLSLEGTSYHPGHGLPVQQFRSAERKQRAALLLVNGTVFIGFGTVAESASTARGWLIAVDTTTFKVTAAWTSTSRGSGGGIWHSGGGPAADAQGYIYVVTGNGDFDAITDFAESIVKLRYTPPSGIGQGSLAVVDWWTPWTDDGRIGGNPQGEKATVPAPSNRRLVARLAAQGVRPMDMGSAWGDQDFGAGGPVLAPSADVVLAAGKDGILYTANMQNLGKTRPSDLDPGATARNYGKLKAPPIFYTYYPGPQLSPVPTTIASLNVLEAQRTHHLHGTPALWKSAAHGLVHFCWGENGNLRAWAAGKLWSVDVPRL